jgi:peptidyl-prolyl cis-trans isomerase SurA
MRTFAASALLLALAAAPAAAQPSAAQPGEELADRVVAVVGDSAVLLSDIQIEVARLQSAGQQVPTDPEGQAALARQILDTKIEDMLLLQAAERAGTAVADREVQEEVDRRVAQVRRNFPSEQEFLTALSRSGRTVQSYREELTREFVAQTKVQNFIRDRIRSMPRPAVTDDEAKAFFDRQRAQMGTRPANVSFQQAIVTPQASDAAKTRARTLADSILTAIRAGEDFEVMARRFSADSASRERGGDLGWFRPGQMVRPFEAAAYAIRPGDVVGPVESEFGFHLIKLEKVRGPERQARHILIAPEVTEADVAAARQRADSIAAAVRAGASLVELADRVKTPSEQVVVRHAPVDRIPPAYVTAVGAAGEGSVVGPFEGPGAAGRTGFVVLRITERQEAGSYEFADVADQARSRLQERRQVQALVDELRANSHVRIEL